MYKEWCWLLSGRSCSPTVFTYLLLELCAAKQEEYTGMGDTMSKIQVRSHIAMRRGREAKRAKRDAEGTEDDGPI